MYEAFYGLREKPFSILPDPDLIYWCQNHRLAFRHARVRRDEQRRLYGDHWRNRLWENDARPISLAKARRSRHCMPDLEHAALPGWIAAVDYDVA